LTLPPTEAILAKIAPNGSPGTSRGTKKDDGHRDEDGRQQDNEPASDVD
jgi:hypothetical protein